MADGEPVGADANDPSTGRSPDVTWHAGRLTRAQRWELLDTEGVVVWLTGLSGSGKSTVATLIEAELVRSGRSAVVLDGDNLRHGLNADLGFGESDRRENVRRVTEVAVLFAQAGVVTLVPVISPYRSARTTARERVGSEGIRFLEVFVDTPVEECERRDPKGLYAKARAGEITGFTGVDAPYEAPEHPDLRLTPDDGDAEAHASLVTRLVIGD
ncbi:MAG TPA: adenylyl-sulfate kinase [Microthrixaceae bacterium]|nr:adenylyl-sulfate kinase [Microthrixaceae bacterium]